MPLGENILELPIIKNKLSVDASLRTSYYNFYESPTIKELTRKVFQSTKIEDDETENTNFDFLMLYLLQ